MQFYALALTVASAALASAQSGLTINTPTSVVQCQPVALSWNGGTAPYYVSIIPGGQAGAAALESFPQQSGNSYTWTVDLNAGTSITVQIKDGTGNINYSQQVTIQAGSTTNCAASSGGSSAAAGGAGASSAAGTATESAAAAASATGMTTSTRAAASAAGSVSAAAQSVASGAASAAGAASSSVTTSGASHIGAGLFTVAAGALLALFA